MGRWYVVKRNEIAGAVMAYFAAQWALVHPSVLVVSDNVTPPAQQPNPADIEASCWLRSRVSDVDGPRQYTYGGTDKSEGSIIFQAFSPIGVGVGYADSLVDDAIEILRKKTINGVEFYPWAETFLGYEEESGYWWQSLGVTPFRVLDDGLDLQEMTMVTLKNGPAGLELYRDTADATLTELLIGGVDRATIPEGLQLTFDIDILGTRTLGGTEAAHYRIQGAIENRAGTVALIGDLDKKVYNQSAGLNATVVADNTNDCLSVRVTGGAYPMHWHAWAVINRSLIA